MEAKRSWASARRTLSDGVSRPLETVKSVGRIVKVRIDSARETASLARATARSRASRMRWSPAAWTGLRFSIPWEDSHRGSISASRVMSAPMHGRLSPTTSTWLTSG